MKRKFKLEKDEKQILIDEIKRYYLKERNEEIGDLAADLILDFITQKIAPVFYNRGVRDSIAVMNEKVEELYGLEI